MNDVVKKSYMKRLLTLLAVLYVFNPYQALAQDSANTSSKTINTKTESDLLMPLNSSFLGAYSSLLNQILANNNPIIIQVGDKVVLYKNNVRTESTVISPRYTEFKTISHIPITLYVMLINVADKKIDTIQLNKLRDFKVLIELASTLIAARDFEPNQRDRQIRIMNRSIAFIDAVLINRVIQKNDLHQFALRQREDIDANSYDAAEDQINILDRQFKLWFKDMNPKERQNLRIIVGAPHMPRIGLLAMQYFSAALGEPYEGGYEIESAGKDGTVRVIYGEDIFDEEKALQLLGKHLVDEGIGTYFFNDSQRLHRDILSDAAEQIIRQKMHLKELSTVQ